MKKFRVSVEGKNFKLKNQERDNKKGYGFYTTRYVEAINEDSATKNTLDLIREEIKNHVVKDSAQNQPEMFVGEIVELESFEDALVPGKGFSWYPQK